MIGFGFGLSTRGRQSSPGTGPAFTPLSLDPALWLDPSDAGTLFQDGQGTVPVTAPGDPLGRIADKSGNGNDALQAYDPRPVWAASARPVWAGGGLWDNTGALGLALAADIQVAEVFAVAAFGDPQATQFTGYPTVICDLAGIGGTTADRVMGSDGTAEIHAKSFGVSVDGGGFGDTLLPLGLSVLRIRKDDQSTWPLGAIGTENNDIASRAWPGKLGEVIAFASHLSEAQAGKVREYMAAKIA